MENNNKNNIEEEEDRQITAPVEMDRRKALATLGKYALLSSPVMTTLVTSRKASAWSPPSPP